MTNQQKVEEFMRRAQQAIPASPTLPSVRVRFLRSRLIGDELHEFNNACMTGNILDIADAIGDLLYVVYGAAVAFGLDAQGIFDEVHRSNMTKHDGRLDEDGKLLKGPSYEPPNLKPFIEPAGSLEKQQTQTITQNQQTV